MKRIEATIGYREETENGVNYFGDRTNNGECYKDLSAWENGTGVIYIGEYALNDKDESSYWTKEEWIKWVKDSVEDCDIFDIDFIEYLAHNILYVCDWQELSSYLEGVDIELEYGSFMAENLIQYVDNNFNYSIYDLQYTYSQMCMNKTNLMEENERLYEHISNLIEDFVIDNDLEEDWAEDFGIDVQDVFEKVLIRN